MDNLKTVTIDEEIYQWIWEEIADGKNIFSSSSNRNESKETEQEGIVRVVNQTRFKEALLQQFIYLKEKKSLRDQEFTAALSNVHINNMALS